MVLKHTEVLVAALLTAVLSGCATAPAVVRPGDRVELSFSCRLPGGALAITTRPDAELTGEVKSPLYLQRTGPETVSLQAVKTPSVPGVAGVKAFELAALDLLAPQTIGTTVGKSRSIVLEAPRYTGLPRNEEYISITRINHYPKVIRMTADEYTAQTGLKAAVGQPYGFEPAIPGTVSEVSEKEIVVSFTAQAGSPVVTPFGIGALRETDSEYSYTIEALPGTLVRTVDSIGRIVNVKEDSIDLDYGHPFGGETLHCDLTVKAVEHVTRPVATREDILNGMLNDALAKGSNGSSIIIENFDKELAAREARTARTVSPAMTTAASGDLAMVDYQAMLEDGSLFLTTRKEVVEDPNQIKVSWYVVAGSYQPEAITVGKPARLPAIGEAVIGMKPGESRRLTLTPEQAFGQPDPRKRKEFPLVITLPRSVTLPADEFVKRAGTFPVMGQEVALTPYFAARVTAVRDLNVDLEFQVEDGQTFVDAFGTTKVKKTATEIITTLAPVIGSSFPLPEGSGIIIAGDSKTFTVDQNHPLTGQTVVIDLQLTALTKAADLPAGDLSWQEEHDAGLAAALQAGKPAVMVLYADWCGYCTKLFSETMPDPRISSLRDSFTWIRVNSDKLIDIKKRYNQQGYPLIVLFRADGTQARMLDGYQDAAPLRAALQEVL